MCAERAAPSSDFIESFAAIRNVCMWLACFQSSHDANEFILLHIFHFLYSAKGMPQKLYMCFVSTKNRINFSRRRVFISLVSLAGRGDDKRATIELIHDDGKGPRGKRIVTDHDHSTCIFFFVDFLCIFNN